MAPKSLCSIPDCNKPAITRGLCGVHYRRWLAHDAPAKFRPCIVQGCTKNSHHTAGGKQKRCTTHYRAWKEQNSPIRCSIQGCNRAHYGKGLCQKHWTRISANGDLKLRRRPNASGNKYMENVVLSYDRDECLPWPFSNNGVGYGTLWIDGASVYAHRLVCENTHGAPPTPSHFALHTCGNGHLGCVNPKHIRWGLPAENTADARDHGTIARGETHGRAKLSEADVLQIRAMKGEWSNAEIAQRFGVSTSLISLIHTRQRWAHL